MFLVLLRDASQLAIYTISKMYSAQQNVITLASVVTFFHVKAHSGEE